jgi:hypothetical protein
MQQRTIYGIIILFFLISALSIFGFFCRHRSTDKSLTKADKQITAGELATSFEHNEILSDSLYLYKILSVKGVIQKISKNESGNYVAMLGDEAPGKTAVEGTFDTLYNQQPFPLKSGDSVVVRGTCAGRLLNVILIRCIIEKQQP